MATYTKQTHSTTTSISIEKAADNEYISVQIRSYKRLGIVEGAHIWVPVAEFKRLVDNLGD